MNFNLDTFSARMQEVEEWLKKEFAGIRTGAATPALLDAVRVDSYGTHVPLNQVASVGVEDARTIRIAPWDASQITAIEKAITDADLGLSVASDASGVRTIFPELTGERREQLVKFAKQKLEDARVSIRSHRDDVMKQLDKLEKDGEMSEDEKFRHKEAVQKVVDERNAELDALMKDKEAQIRKV